MVIVLKLVHLEHQTKQVTSDGGTIRTTPKLTAKVPSHSITTSGIALYMPNSVKVSYNQSYDTDTEAGLAGDFEATGVAVAGAEGAAKVKLSCLTRCCR